MCDQSVLIEGICSSSVVSFIFYPLLCRGTLGEGIYSVAIIVLIGGCILDKTSNINLCFNLNRTYTLNNQLVK